MERKIAVAAISLLMMTSSLTYAAETSSTVGMRGPSATDLNSLTDMRVGLVKAALQMTAEQEKLWPAVEEAIRTRSKDRIGRLERVAELRDNASSDAALGERNPLEIMQRRADLLLQRGNDLKRVVDAWEPLYKTLSQDQKRRMAFVSTVAFRGMRDAVEHRSEFEDDDD